MITFDNLIASLFGIEIKGKIQYKAYSLHLTTGYTINIHDEVKRLNATEARVLAYDDKIRVRYLDAGGKRIGTQQFKRKFIVYGEVIRSQ